MTSATATKAKLHKSRIDIPEADRTKIIEFLNQSLATMLDLKTQIKYAHWNVKGMDFYQLHKLFDELAEGFDEHIDEVAERITALAGTALGTVRMSAKATQLPEFPENVYEGKEYVTLLAERFGIYTAHLRELIDKTDELGDKDTADLYTELSREADKYLWFLEAHIQA